MSDSPITSSASAGLKGAFFRQGLILAAAVFVLDQITKWLILDLFANGPRVIEVTGFFNLVLAWNRGISFGMFGASSAVGVWILVSLALVISAVLIRFMMKAETRFAALAFALVIGGAIGNVIDRVRFGAVVDFLDVHAMGYHWPAFNVADSAITIGAAALILESLFSDPETS